MLELVRDHPPYGYRRIWPSLRREGRRVNRKRIHRLRRKEGLKMPQKQGKSGTWARRPTAVRGGGPIDRKNALSWGLVDAGRRGACTRGLERGACLGQHFFEQLALLD